MNLIKLVFSMIWLMANQKIYEIASDPKYDGHQRGLASMFYKFFDKKSALFKKSSGSDIVNEPIIN